jgi:hypothetical protein
MKQTRERALALINEGIEILDQLAQGAKPTGWRADERRAANEHTGYKCNVVGVNWDDTSAKWRVSGRHFTPIGMFADLDEAIAAKNADLARIADNIRNIG